MKIHVYQTRLNQLLEQRNGFLVLAAGTLILCLCLTLLLFYSMNHSRTIVTPAVVEKPFWVSNSEVSADYLSQMALFLVGCKLNLTPENADSMRKILLRYTDPRYYGAFNTALIAEHDRIIQQHINTVFYPIDITVDAKNLTAVVTGDLYSGVGTTQLAPQHLSYQFQFTYRHGRLLIKNFNEVKSNA